MGQVANAAISRGDTQKILTCLKISFRVSDGRSRMFFLGPSTVVGGGADTTSVGSMVVAGDAAFNGSIPKCLNVRSQASSLCRGVFGVVVFDLFAFRTSVPGISTDCNRLSWGPPLVLRGITKSSVEAEMADKDYIRRG